MEPTPHLPEQAEDNSYVSVQFLDELFKFVGIPLFRPPKASAPKHHKAPAPYNRRGCPVTQTDGNSNLSEKPCKIQKLASGSVQPPQELPASNKAVKGTLAPTGDANTPPTQFKIPQVPADRSLNKTDSMRPPQELPASNKVVKGTVSPTGDANTPPTQFKIPQVPADGSLNKTAVSQQSTTATSNVSRKRPYSAIKEGDSHRKEPSGAQDKAVEGMSAPTGVANTPPTQFKRPITHVDRFLKTTVSLRPPRELPAPNKVVKGTFAPMQFKRPADPADRFLSTTGSMHPLQELQAPNKGVEGTPAPTGDANTPPTQLTVPKVPSDGSLNKAAVSQPSTTTTATSNVSRQRPYSAIKEGDRQRKESSAAPKKAVEGALAPTPTGVANTPPTQFKTPKVLADRSLNKTAVSQQSTATSKKKGDRQREDPSVVARRRTLSRLQYPLFNSFYYYNHPEDR